MSLSGSPLSGNWDVTVKTPMGDQRLRLEVDAGPSSFTGHMSGALGEMAIPDGTVSGDTLSCTLRITSPMPMQVDVTATVAGDRMTGSVDAGLFGAMPLEGVRAG